MRQKKPVLTSKDIKQLSKDWMVPVLKAYGLTDVKKSNQSPSAKECRQMIASFLYELNYSEREIGKFLDMQPGFGSYSKEKMDRFCKDFDDFSKEYSRIRVEFMTLAMNT